LRAMFEELQDFQRSLIGYIRSVFLREYAKLSILAAMIGCAAAFIAIGFRYLILFFQDIFFSGGTPLHNDLGVMIVIIPAIGAVFVGLITHFWAPETKGAGVAEVMQAVQVNKGRVRKRVPIAKALASSLTIGSGGSAGREGPIVQIGASFASIVGRFFKLTSTEMRIMVACGAAGGIAATFNTPIAGAIFALELLLLEFKTRSFVPLIISSVFATVVSRNVLGDYPTFDVGLEFGQTSPSPFELVLYLLLGLLAGLIGVLFIKTLYKIDDVFAAIKMAPYTKPVLGALMVGAIALFYPSIMGVGYDTVGMALNGEMDGLFPKQLSLLPIVVLVCTLLFMKLIATSLTLGSGGSGGVFAPSLFLGAMLGSAFGMAAIEFFPGETTGYGAFALVGMAAVLAATSRATLTAILMLFELTSTYEIILPLMFACVVSDVVSSLLTKETIYTAKLAKRGIKYVHDLEANILEYVRVKDAMYTDFTIVRPDMTLDDIEDFELETGEKGFPVIDQDGKLRGIVTATDVRKAYDKGMEKAVIREIMTKRVVTVFPDDSLQSVVEKMVLRDIGHIPVIDPGNPNRLLGMLDRESVLERYRGVLSEEVSPESLQGRLYE